jgi:hypothetical protein
LEAHEAAELAVCVTEDAATGGGAGRPLDAAIAEWQDAKTVLDSIEATHWIARAALLRDIDRSPHPAARALRGV